MFAHGARNATEHFAEGGWYDRPEQLPRRRGEPVPVTVVASYYDLTKVRAQGRPVVLVEHGAGQSYTGETHGSYVGGADRFGVVGVIVPGDDSLARHRAAHPTISAVAVGCPKMDRWLRGVPPAAPEPGLVAFAWHWDREAIPEARSAWTYYAPYLGKVAERCPVLGHGHPLERGRWRHRYAELGWPFAERLGEVFTRASVLVADNTSAMFEFALLGRPVVVLNAPWYRRDVQHGGRFWDWADVGLQCDDPHTLPDVIAEALTDPPDVARRRREIVAQIYAVRDGSSAKHAAAFIDSLEACT